MKKKQISMILRPVKHGKKHAVVLSDEILEAAGFSKSGEIRLTVSPSGGLLLEAVESTNEDSSHTAFKKVKRKYARLFERLADR